MSGPHLTAATSFTFSKGHPSLVSERFVGLGVAGDRAALASTGLTQNLADQFQLEGYPMDELHDNAIIFELCAFRKGPERLRPESARLVSRLHACRQRWMVVLAP